jgi:hypothetical protein
MVSADYSVIWGYYANWGASILFGRNLQSETFAHGEREHRDPRPFYHIAM